MIILQFFFFIKVGCIFKVLVTIAFFDHQERCLDPLESEAV